MGSRGASSERWCLLVAEDEAAVVGAGLEVAAREPARDLQEERVLLPVLQRVASHGGLGQCFLPGSAGERVVGAAAVPETRRHVPRERVYLARGVAERPGRYSDRAAQRHRLRRSRHRYAVALVAPRELVADLVAPQRAEVQVYVRGV